MLKYEFVINLVANSSKRIVPSKKTPPYIQKGLDCWQSATPAPDPLAVIAKTKGRRGDLPFKAV